MNYEKSGSGSPSIVFAHGFTCDGSDWASVANALSASHAVVTCDLPGHGRSPADFGPPSIDSYAAVIGQLVDTLELDRVIIVGHSLGCRVALELCAAHPRVAGAVLVEGGVQATGDATSAEANVRHVIADQGYQRFVRQCFDEMFFVDSPFREHAIARAACLAAEYATDLYAAMVRWDVSRLNGCLHRTAERGLPIACIQSTVVREGRRRRLESPAQSAWLQAVLNALPDAQVHVLHGRGHFVQVEAVDEVRAIIAAFVSRF